MTAGMRKRWTIVRYSEVDDGLPAHPSEGLIRIFKAEDRVGAQPSWDSHRYVTLVKHTCSGDTVALKSVMGDGFRFRGGGETLRCIGLGGTKAGSRLGDALGPHGELSDVNSGYGSSVYPRHGSAIHCMEMDDAEAGRGQGDDRVAEFGDNWMGDALSVITGFGDTDGDLGNALYTNVVYVGGRSVGDVLDLGSSANDVRGLCSALGGFNGVRDIDNALGDAVQDCRLDEQALEQGWKVRRRPSVIDGFGDADGDLGSAPFRGIVYVGGRSVGDILDLSSSAKGVRSLCSAPGGFNDVHDIDSALGDAALDNRLGDARLPS
ncbi:unnamed protein product [Ilex paraguariensis]|uniref:Uncharacterized protein n=1 Tax=Ilex paraguariensis TaxID=185542 RepID=A0ABC8RI32_9AQUA